MPRLIESIHTDTSMEDLWNRLLYSSTVEGAKKLISNRISTNFFGLDYETLNQSKNQNPSPLDGFRVIEERDVSSQAVEMSFSLRQAKEFYDSARTATELTKPILLYYGMVSLANALIVSTYIFQNPKRGHGIEANFSREQVKIRNRGFFTRFHDSYEESPALYINEPQISLTDLFSTMPELASEFRLLYQRDPTVQAPDPEIAMDTHHQVTLAGHPYPIPSLTSHFLAMFYLGSIARYKPKEWGYKIQGEEVYIIRKFLSVSTRRFPNVILNELWERHSSSMPLLDLDKFHYLKYASSVLQQEKQFGRSLKTCHSSDFVSSGTRPSSPIWRAFFSSFFIRDGSWLRLK